VHAADAEVTELAAAITQAGWFTGFFDGISHGRVCWIT
jgi:hypothetical protein